MKKFFTIAVLVFVFSICMTQVGTCMPEKGKGNSKVNLFDILEDAKEVNVYVAPVTDSSGNASTMTADLRKVLENALATRMSIHFVVVQDEMDADMVISCDIIERIWLKDDPIDQVHGLVGVAIDIALKENYARIVAIFEVKKGPKQVVLFKKRGGLFKRLNVLWKEEIHADLTKPNMPEDVSKPLIGERLVSVFMRMCFSRNAKPLKR